MFSPTDSLPIDTTALAPREPSICIPRVFANITEGRVRAILRNLDLGEVERVDMIQRENAKGEKFQRVFIHFVEWYDTTEDGQPNENAIEVRQRLLKGIEVKVVYDNPWFWKLSASKVARPEDRVKHAPRPKPFLDLTHSARAPEINNGGNRSGNRHGGKAPLSKAEKAHRKQPTGMRHVAVTATHAPAVAATATHAPAAPTAVKVTKHRKTPPPLEM